MPTSVRAGPRPTGALSHTFRESPKSSTTAQKDKTYDRRERVISVNSDQRHDPRDGRHSRRREVPGRSRRDRPRRSGHTVRVRQSAELYRRIGGAWCGIVGAALR
ncbi:hypothetical protein EF918_32145 [Streptomyces sp. WAC06614]|nr:hypothetical protein EF918_32145 [Streptomyces sp. WAC06614]